MTKAHTIALSLLLLFPALSASSQTSQEADARKAADSAFEQKRWVDAERAYLAYSRRMPPPKDAGAALMRVAECRMKVKDTAGAVRVLGQVIADMAVAKREPDVLAAAYALQHSLHAKAPSKASDRARLLDDFRKRLPAHPQLLSLYEREADALVTEGKIVEATKYYALAGNALSGQGKRLSALLAGHASLSPHDLVEVREGDE